MLGGSDWARGSEADSLVTVLGTQSILSEDTCVQAFSYSLQFRAGNSPEKTPVKHLISEEP